MREDDDLALLCFENQPPGNSLTPQVVKRRDRVVEDEARAPRFNANLCEEEGQGQGHDALLALAEDGRQLGFRETRHGSELELLHPSALLTSHLQRDGLATDA